MCLRDTVDSLIQGDWQVARLTSLQAVTAVFEAVLDQQNAGPSSLSDAFGVCSDLIVLYRGNSTGRGTFRSGIMPLMGWPDSSSFIDGLRLCPSDQFPLMVLSR